MRKKLSLPILLLAVVVMLSVFYIKEADKTIDPVGGSSLEQSSTNPDFAEARLQSIQEVNAIIEDCEMKIASGKLTAVEVERENALINSLKEIKVNEIALEEMIMAALDYEDVLVLIEDNFVMIDIYTDEEISVANFIKVSRLAKERFSSDYTVKVSTTTSV